MISSTTRANTTSEARFPPLRNETVTPSSVADGRERERERERDTFEIIRMYVFRLGATHQVGEQLVKRLCQSALCAFNLGEKCRAGLYQPLLCSDFTIFVSGPSSERKEKREREREREVVLLSSLAPRPLDFPDKRAFPFHVPLCVSPCETNSFLRSCSSSSTSPLVRVSRPAVP